MKRHPSQPLMARYGAGELPAGPSLVVEAHLESCDSCSAQVRALEDLEGQFLTALSDAPMAPDALEAALRRLEDCAAASRPWRTPEWLRDVRLPTGLSSIGLQPRRWLTSGVWVAHLAAPRAGGWRTCLLHARAGDRIPRHNHPGEEIVAVLKGSFDDGRTWVAGDFVENPPHSEHEATVSEDCICLFSIHG